MNTAPNDADYPYSARNRAAQATSATSTLDARWKIWTWIFRIVGSIAVLFTLIVLVCGIITGRAAWRARSIASIERFGTNVSYSHQQPNQTDRLPEALRERLGDRWFSEVVEVNHRGEDYFEPPFTFGKLTEDDVGEICKICGSFPKLRKFLIDTDLFSCRQIENWPRLAQLETLDLESVRLNDTDLAIIGRMTGLKQLRLSGAEFTSAGFEYLARLPRLEYLTIDKVRFEISPSSLPQGFSALKDLVVNQSPEFNDDAIAVFGSPPQLDTVHFNRTPIGDRGLSSLLRGGKIKTLTISEGAITDTSMKALASYPPPSWLVLSGMPLTDAGVAALAGQPFSTLIMDHTLVTDEAFRALNKMPNIDYVPFADSKVTGIGISYLQPSLTLKHLDISGPALTPAGIRALAKAACNDLSFTGATFGDQELMLFVPNNQLTSLQVAGTQVTDQGLRAFYAARRRHFTKRGWTEHLRIVRDPFGDEDSSIPTNELDTIQSGVSEQPSPADQTPGEPS